MEKSVKTDSTSKENTSIGSDKKVATSYETTYSSGASQRIPPLKGFDNAIFSKTHGVPLSYDDWYSENEDHLLDIWNSMQSIVYDRGLFMLDRGGFHHLCAFIASNTTLEHNPHYDYEFDEDS